MQQSPSGMEQKRRQGKHEHQIRSKSHYSRKNHLKENVPDFLKEPGKLWGQDTKQQSILWKTKAVRQVSNNNTKPGIVSCVKQRKMEHTKQWLQ